MADWVDQLLAGLATAPQTRAQYAAGLRYWDSWHQLRFNTSLGLAETPPCAVSSETVAAFIEDHLAIAVEGRLQMRMGRIVLDGLRQAGYKARVNCVAPTTSDWRLRVLQRAHRLQNLRFDFELVRRRKPEIYAAWESERAALGIPVTLPMSATGTVNALLNVCGDDDEGVMDAALILLLCRLTPGQVAHLRFLELRPGTIVQHSQEVDFVELTIRVPLGQIQTSQPRIRFIGVEATLIKAWGAIREDRSQVEHDLFFVKKARRNSGPALNLGWIGRRIRHLAQQAGLSDASGRTPVSPQWLRKAHEREWREHSNLVKAARAARIDTRSVIRMVHRSVT